MSENRNGRVVTFYSFKGGTGRTMALANVAWILAANGKRVLVVDWDLESPGLHRFYHPFMDGAAMESASGIIDMIREYEDAASRRSNRESDWREHYADVRRYAFSLSWSFPREGTLDFLPAGRQNGDYAVTVAGLDWDNFYERLGGGQFFDALRANMKRHYDYVLIDSRTGLSDVADICTLHLPDVLVDCFTFSEQGIAGAAQVASAIANRFRDRRIRVLPVPMRVDPAEKDRADVGRQIAMRRFAGLPAGMTDVERQRYWLVTEVPYQPFYAYEEMLATFGDPPGSSRSILAAYEALTSYLTVGEITALPPMDEPVRRRVMDRFRRTLVRAEDSVVLRYEAEDEVWAEWIASVLGACGVQVLRPESDEESPRASSVEEVLIISRAYAERHGPASLPVDQPSPIGVYVADVPALRLPHDRSVRIAGRSEESAIELLLRAVGWSDAQQLAVESARARFPAEEPVVFNVPARNPRFTGRVEELRELRQLLVKGLRVPTALQGLGGVGKTQVALEYAHRFRNAYDIVWWITADPATFIDSQLIDLGIRLSLPPDRSGVEAVRRVLNTLGRGEPSQRWLLIFDNADDMERVGPFLPQGGGHVLITSRNTAWGERAAPMEVDVFRRRESVEHLTRRVPSITAAAADQIADLMGDLPIAIAATAAWLADTGGSADDYIRQVAEAGQAAFAGSAVQATWDLSLQRLVERSPAAYRMLQLFSVMAPEIALDLAYSSQFAAALAPIDSSVSERLIRAGLVQQINRLALLKLDPASGEVGGQVVVHRLLQRVIQWRMSDEELADARHEVHQILAAFRPDDEVDDPATWPRFRKIWPHMDASGAVTCDLEDVRRLLIDRVRYLWITGDDRRGLEFGRQVERDWVQSRPEADPDRQLLLLRHNISNLLRSVGRFEEARALDEKVLRDQRRLLGDEHPHTLMSASSFAADLRALGRYAEALEHDRVTYAAWAERYGDENPRTLSALNNLATSYRLMGDYRLALHSDEKAFAHRRAILGGSGLDTLVSAGALGRDLRDGGDYARSAELLTQTAQEMEHTYDADARPTLNATVNLALSLRSSGRPQEAVAVLDRAFASLAASHPDAPDTLDCRLSRAITLLAVGQLDFAESELREVHKRYRDRLGDRHPVTLICVNDLALALRAKADPGATGLVDIAVHGFLDVLGPDHPHTLAARSNLAVCLAERGDAGQAAAIIDDTVNRSAMVLGEGHPDSLRYAGNRALIQRMAGQETVDPQPIVARMAEHLGDGHPAVLALREGRLLHRLIDPQPF